MNAPFRVALPGFMLALLTSGLVLGQTPLGGDRVIAAFHPNVRSESAPQPACDDAGVCGLFWIDYNESLAKIEVLAVVLSPQGQMLSQPRVLAYLDFAFELGVIAVGLERGFATLWENQFSDGHISPVLRYYDESLSPQGDAITLPFVQGLTGVDNPIAYGAFFDIVRTPSGFALYAAALDTPSVYSGVFVLFIDRHGNPIDSRRRLNADTSANPVAVNGLAVQPNGDLIAVYWRYNGLSVFQRLAADGTPLGSEVVVNVDRGASQPAVATAPDGSFWVVWQSSSGASGSHDIMARRFSADGRSLGIPFQVNNVHQVVDQGFPAITADAAGNYFIAWQSFYLTFPFLAWEIKGRLFRHDGTPVSGEIRLNQERQLEQQLPQVAFAPDGRVVVGWMSWSSRQIGTEIVVPVAHTFAASAGQEVCAVTGSRVSCDLARTGGEGELQFVWGGRPGEVTLFGDWDGDGRDDVCGYYLGRFRCDVNHAGRATVFERLGQPGDVPPLADIDGDGRADPCVRRGDQLFCDPEHDGTAELKLTFGAVTVGVPLLGDLDGDRKADYCHFLSGAWSCRTQAGEVTHFGFGQL